MTNSGVSATWRSKSFESWRGTLGVLASRGEVDSPRVQECKQAMSTWRLHTFLIDEWGWTAAAADRAVNQLVDAAITAPKKTPGGKS